MKARVFLDDQQIRSSEDLIDEPEISVIMPTYCRGDCGLLQRAIRSVLQQTFHKFELIIVDDGSRDCTRSVVSGFLESDNRIRYVRHDMNSGLPALRVNEGLMLARGNYVAYQFDDDQWLPEALDTLLAGRCRDSGVVVGQSRLHHKGMTYILGRPASHAELLIHNRFANNAVLHGRELCELYGTYDMHIAMRRLCDWDLWLRWIAKVPFVFVDKMVSVIDAGLERSIGETVPMDLPLFYILNAINRLEALRLSQCFDEEVDTIYPPVLLGPQPRNALTRQIREYLTRHRDMFDVTSPERS